MKSMLLGFLTGVLFNIIGFWQGQELTGVQTLFVIAVMSFTFAIMESVFDEAEKKNEDRIR